MRPQVFYHKTFDSPDHEKCCYLMAVMRVLKVKMLLPSLYSSDCVC